MPPEPKRATLTTTHLTQFGMRTVRTPSGKGKTAVYAVVFGLGRYLPSGEASTLSPIVWRHGPDVWWSRLRIGFAALLAGLLLLLISGWTVWPSSLEAQTVNAQTADSEGNGPQHADGLSTASDSADGVDSGVFDVVEVSGYLDSIMADFIERSIRKAASGDSLGLVLQINSSRALIDDSRLEQVAVSIRDSEVPVSMWIGPSGAVAKGRVGQLAGVVSDLALAPGSALGDLGSLVLPESHLSEAFLDAYPRMVQDALTFEEAIELGLAREAPTLPFFVLDLPNFQTQIDNSGDEPVRVPVSSVRFAKLSLLEQFMHTAASPALAYLLLLAGAGMLVFEFYTAGVGIVGFLGSCSFLLGCYGLAALPTRGWALALLGVALFGYCVDIQTGIPRVWTVIATLSLVAGSLLLFAGGLLSWVTLLAGIVGMFAGMVAGMPAMVRTRFGTPRIGRDWMIGTTGTARDPVSPEGVVMIDGAPWRARTQRATPIAAGDPVRVVSLEGLILGVEPVTSDQSESIP